METIRFFNIFQKFTPQPIKLSVLVEMQVKPGRLLNKHIREKKNNSNETAETVNIHFFNYKSMGIISCHSCYSNKCYYQTGIKTQFMYRVMSLICMQSISFSHLTVSEKKTFYIYTKSNLFCRPGNQAASSSSCRAYM